MTDLKKTMDKIKQLHEAVRPMKGKEDIRTSGNNYAQRIQAEAQSGLEVLQYKKLFPWEAEIVLLNSPKEAETVGHFQDMDIITVDAGEFFDIVAKDTKTLYPAADSRPNDSSFGHLIKSVNVVCKQVRVPMDKQLNYQAGSSELSLSDNFRESVRSQVGIKGFEPTWVFLKAVSTALEKKLDTDPLPVVVYNIRGATQEDYRRVFRNVTVANMEVGDEKDVKKFIKTFTNQLKEQGKIASTKAKPAREDAETKTEVKE